MAISRQQAVTPRGANNRYHPRFREVRESTKYERVVAFADELPAIREKVREHMDLRGLPRERVLATVVHLLETTLIRVSGRSCTLFSSPRGIRRSPWPG